MSKELLFVIVIGKDRKGIIAKISQMLYERGINIEDVDQKVMEGYFVMTMLVDMKDSTASLDEVRNELERIESEMHLKIQIQHENIFKQMHRV